MVAIMGGCKLTVMGVEDIKRDEEAYERLDCTEKKLVEKA